MASTQTRIVIYRDDVGQLYVLDEMDKVPARYRDRAVEINPKPNPTLLDLGGDTGEEEDADPAIPCESVTPVVSGEAGRIL